MTQHPYPLAWSMDGTITALYVVENYGGGARFATLYFEPPIIFAIGSGRYSTHRVPARKAVVNDRNSSHRHFASIDISATLNLLGTRHYRSLLFQPHSGRSNQGRGSTIFSIYNPIRFALPSATAGTYHFPAG